jgi:glycosyltransferase involved in cell wall biosynthesis
MSRIRVVFLTSSMQVGGQEQYIAQQIQNLDRKRFEPLLCCLKNAGPLAEGVRAAGIPVSAGFQRFKYDAGALVRLTRFLLRHRPSVLYIFDFRNVLFIGRLAAKLARVPVCVIACHKMNYKGSGRSYPGWLDRLLMPLTDHVIAAADAHRAALIEKDGLPAAKITTIHNGIDLSRLARDAAPPIGREALGVPPGCPIIGVVARLAVEKSHETVLSAMPRILESAPTAHVVFVGDGPHRACLEDRARTSGLASRVRFLGVHHRVALLLDHFDVFALASSMGELFSAATLEAMAFGLPVVVTDVGGMREMVVNGVTGLLVPPNEPVAFADAVIRLLARPDLRASMGKAGAERVRARFTAEREARELGNLLGQLVAASARNSSRRTTRQQAETGGAARDR